MGNRNFDSVAVAEGVVMDVVTVAADGEGVFGRLVDFELEGVGFIDVGPWLGCVGSARGFSGFCHGTQP